MSLLPGHTGSASSPGATSIWFRPRFLPVESAVSAYSINSSRLNLHERNIFSPGVTALLVLVVGAAFGMLFECLVRNGANHF